MNEHSHAWPSVDAMIANMERLISESEQRKREARAAFSTSVSLADAIAAVLSMNETALIIGSTQALESFRVSPSAARVLLMLHERGDIDFLESCFSSDNELRVMARPRGWLVWGPPSIGP